MNILGIETSCDETGLAIYHRQKGLLGHVLYSQIDLHRDYGGVVPELASRDHVQRLMPLLNQLLKDAKLDLEHIDGVAYTRGPGLFGALMVGAMFGYSLGQCLNVPTIGIHHLEGHLLAPFLEDNTPTCPFVALLVSGGHTMLIEVRALGSYRILGQSVDDAAGEAFDKTAKLMGLGYPGGPQLAKLAQQGDARRFLFPKPMLKKSYGLNFSFSGLKTAVRQTLQKYPNDRSIYPDVAASFEQAVVDTLVTKCRWAIEQTGHHQLVVAGGVSANIHLRRALDQTMASMGKQVFYPKHEFCTDNGAMIAIAGAYRLASNPAGEMNCDVKARWDISSLPRIKLAPME